VRLAREALNKAVEEAARPIEQVQELLRKGSPPRTGTPGRAKAVASGHRNFEGRKLVTTRLDGQETVELATDPAAVKGKPIADAEVSPDHIYAMDRIFEEDGFNLLTIEQQAEILELPENYMPLSGALNSSKRARTMAEWFTTPEGSRIDVRVRPLLIELEAQAQKAVRSRIAQKLAELKLGP